MGAHRTTNEAPSALSRELALGQWPTRWKLETLRIDWIRWARADWMAWGQLLVCTGGPVPSPSLSFRSEPRLCMVSAMDGGATPIGRTMVAWFALGVATLAQAGPADAQPAPTTTTTRGPGRDALDRGLALLRQQRWVEAMPHLEESVRLESTPLGWFNLALAYRGAGRIAAAVQAFERYLAAPEADAPAARLTAIRGEVSGLLRSVARLQLTLTPATATVQVDGRQAAMSAGELRVDPGTHALAFEAAGFEPLRREVNLQAGATMVLELQLRPSAPVAVTPREPVVAVAPAAPITGQLTVEPSIVNATVSVDGSPRGVGPVTLTLPPGEHRVEVRAVDHAVWSQSVQVRAGGAARLSPGLTRLGGGRGWVLPVAIAGGAAVATAVIVGVAVATRGVASPTQGSWGTTQE